MTDTQRPSESAVQENVPPEIEAAPHIGVPLRGVGELKATGGEKLEEYHGAFAEFHEGYVRDYIGLADAKAGLAFALASGVLAYFLGNDQIRALLATPTCSFAFVICLLSTVLLTVSAVFSFLVIAPRLSSPSNEGIVFFGAVAGRRNAIEYISDVAGFSSRDIIEARLKHCFDISRVCSQKYAQLRRAIWVGLPGLILALVAVFSS